MNLAVVGAFQARWTAAIHSEWMRNVLKDRPDLSPAQIERTKVLMDTYAEGSLIEGYEHRIDTLTLPDPDDRHVLAAAIEAEAPIIVTVNLKDFPADVLAHYGIIRQRPDEFLCALYDNDAMVVCEAVRNQRSRLKNPPKTVEEHFATLIQNGLTGFVVCLEPHAVHI